ncbi:hypothetical protein BS78_04G168700 [Paspalum vaginatum]|nr:hypothetical protein BS78_04G168700 [Paspalum vaginatum]
MKFFFFLNRNCWWKKEGHQTQTMVLQLGAQPIFFSCELPGISCNLQLVNFRNKRSTGQVEASGAFQFCCTASQKPSILGQKLSK